MKEKLLMIWLLAILLCVSIDANATYVEIDGFCYELSDTTAMVTWKHGEDNWYWGEITIPEKVKYKGKYYTVTKIGSNAFWGCSALVSVGIPECVKVIEQEAFKDCTALVSFSIPGTVTNISSDIFKGCNNLRSVTFCDGIEELTIKGTLLFSDCHVITLYLGRNICHSGTEDFVISPRDNHFGVFTSKQLESLTISNNVTKLSYMAFAGCEKLTQLNIPSNVSTIGIGAFANCYGLTTLEIDNPSCEINNFAFWDCIALNHLIINVKKVGRCAFSGCKSLTEITLGKDISTIGEYAFEECKYLNDLYCLATTPPSTEGDGKSIFQYISGKDQWGNNKYDYYHKNVNLHVPMSSINEYEAIEPWKSFKSITGIYVPVESIYLDTHDILMDINSTQNITCTITPEDASNKGLEWSSSNELIVSVIDGQLKANNAGEAYVYVSSSDNPNAKDSCLVKVTVPVTGVSLSYNEYTMGVNSQIQLEIVISPLDATNRNVLWNSSNEVVCSVENGLVTALSKGNAIITVTTEDGGFQANCVITVIQPVTGITLSQTNCKLTSIGESIQLEAYVQPEDASNKEVRWSSSNESICVVSQGLVVATGFGTAVVFASSVDGGYMASCIVTVEEPSAIQDITKEQEESPTYDLMGNKVQHTIKGHLYIRNGQKFLAK